MNVNVEAAFESWWKDLSTAEHLLMSREGVAKVSFFAGAAYGTRLAAELIKEGRLENEPRSGS